MALIYTKLTDKTVVLAPRQGMCRKFNFDNDWTEVRIGCFVTVVAATGSDDAAVVESIVPAVATDYMTFGIKDDSETYPGAVGSLFLGMRSYDDNLIQVTGAASGVIDSGGAARAVGYYGTTKVTDATAIGGGGNFGAAAAAGVSAYNQFFALKLIINNRGLSSQTVSVYTTRQASVPGTDYSATALRTAINNASYGGATTIAWNDGAAARDIPDCYWVRAPMYLNCLRLSAIRAIRYAP